MDQSTRFKRAVHMESVVYLGTRHYTHIGLQVLTFHDRDNSYSNKILCTIKTFLSIAVLLKSKQFYWHFRSFKKLWITDWSHARNSGTQFISTLNKLVKTNKCINYYSIY
jgi:hypothetical protein